MTTRLRILAAGPGVTIQDGGRHGFLRIGVTAAGPMDPLAHATVLRAVDLPAGASAIEVSPGGLVVAAEGGPITLALAGGAFVAECDGNTFPVPLVLTLEPGSRLTLKAGPGGVWCYMAVAGGLEIAPVLGSTATHIRSGMGGLNGKPLQAGDLIPIAASGAERTEPARLVAPWLDRSPDTVRVVLGPQDDHFAPKEIAAFLSRPWMVTPRSDRMATLLEGRPLAHLKDFNIVSDGIAHGAVQVPGEGIPLVLMADRQPTGGYPKIATVIGADLGTLAQMRPGARLRFSAVDIGTAVTARRSQAEALAPPVRRVPFIRSRFSSQFLLELNLISGVTDAFASAEPAAE